MSETLKKLQQDEQKPPYKKCCGGTCKKIPKEVAEEK